MINCYTRSIKYIAKVKSSTNILVKDFFATVNLKSVAKSVISASLSNIFVKNSKNSIALFATCLLIVVGAGSVSGATKTWTKTNGGNWTTGGNWTPSGAPAAGDDIVIPADQSANITAVPTLSIKSLTVNGTCTLVGAATNKTLTIGGNASTDLTISNGKTLTIGTNLNITLASNATANIVGTLSLTAGRTLNTNGTGVVTTVTGTINNAGTVTCATATKLLFNSGSTYQHAQNGGTIPTSIWDAASTCLITGVTNTVPTVVSFAQTFGNFTWNCTGQTAAVSLVGNLTTINGDLSVLSTGLTPQALNLAISGVDFNANVLGDYIQSGGNLTLNGTSGICTFNVAGNFNMSGGTLARGSGTGVFNFNGSSIQTFSKSAGTISGSLPFSVLSGSTVDFGTSVLDGINATFNVNSGGNLITANTAGLSTSGATGSIQVGGTRTYNTGANYTYNGSSGQVTGNGLTQNIPANLTINSTNTVSLSAATTISGNLLIAQGTLSTSSSNYNMAVGGNWTNSGGTFTAGTGTVTMNGVVQAIGGTSSTTFYNLTLAGSGTKTITNAISVSNNLNISSGVIASINNGINVPAGSLTLGGFNKASGTWGSTFSSAVNQNNTYFAATTGIVTVNNDTRPIPTFSGITASQSICFGTPTVTLSGTVSAAGPVYPANGETVAVTINGVSQNATIAGGTGGFTINFNSATVPVGSNSITYSYVGDTNLKPAVNSASTTLTVNAVSNTPTATGVSICIGSTTTLSASGAVATDKYVWYNVATGGTALKTSTDNNDNTYTTAVLVATTNYWVSILNASGCETARTQVTATFPAVCTDPLTPGTDSWVGYVYGGRDSNFTNNIYYGHYTEAETFNENFGGDATCFNITSNSISRSIYTQNLSVKYLMNSTKKGLYVVDLGSDDGNRLTVDGTLLYNDWGDHALSSHPGVLMSLKGTSSLMYEYYENGGGNTVYFQNLTQVLANNLTTNTTQTILLGNSGTIISGDAFGALPTGVSLSGTGYQWTYSTTPGGGRTDITGATGPTLTPSNAIAPFNTAGTYYVYRNAILSSANNVAPNPYVATNESNVATITIAAPGVSTSVSTLTGFSYVVGSGPSAEQSLNVVGIGLLGNITVTPPADFEVSVLSGGVFQTTPLTLTAVGGVVNTTVYVRMKQGLTVGGYNSENIVFSTAGFTSKDVACSGIVIPGVTAGGGGSYCANSPINLTSSPSPANITLTNVYWTGPNGFYSVLQNPTISNATTAMSGTYTVTGNYVPPGNLVVNGNFESGNTGFTTSYTLSSGGSTGLYDPGVYAVIAVPHDQHSNFCTSGDHTTGLGLQFVANGAAAPQKIWEPTALITVSPNTNYQFTYWVRTVDSGDASPSQTKLLINGIGAGPINTAITEQGTWTQFAYNWNSGSSTTADLILMSENTVGGGNDFALDDIVFQPVYTSSASVNVSVIATSSPASVTITASPGSSVNSGTSVTFTAAPVNGGTLPVYQWQVNGANVGTNSPTYTYIPTDGNTVICTMASSSGCLASPDPVTSNTITMAVNNPPNYWKGAYSTDWGTASNWTAGYVPGIGDNIVFSTASTSGDALKNLVLDKDRVVGNLTNLSSKQLIIPPAKCLTANGTITTDGNANKIYIQAWPDGTQQNGSLIFHNDVSAPVYASVEMYSKATRDPSGVTDPNTGIIYHYSWQYFGIPLRSVVADPTFYGSFVRRNDEASTNNLGKWLPLANSDVLTSFTGYEITQDAPTTFVFKGALENGDKSIALPYTLGAYDPGQTILANPYAAAIDVRQLTFGDHTEKTVYLYNTGSFGQWAKYNGETTNDTTTTIPGQYIAIPQRVAASIGLPNDIPSMSGFLVKAMDANGGSLAINYNTVITKNVNPQRAPQLAQASDQVYLQITLKGKNYGDRVWLVDEPGTSHGFDNGWDGYKLFGATGTPKLFAMEKDANYQISTTDDMNNTYLGFQAGVDLEDTLTFRSANIAARYSGIYLIDLVENKVIDMAKPGTQYTFKAAATTAPIKRFKVVTQPLDENPANSAPQLKVFNDNNIVFVNNPTDQKGELYFYDIMGRFLKKEPFGPNGISAFPLFSATGAYIVKTVTSTEQVSKKIIIK